VFQNSFFFCLSNFLSKEGRFFANVQNMLNSRDKINLCLRLVFVACFV